MWMNEMEIDEALELVKGHAPDYLPYVQYLSDWRDIVNRNSDGWAYWSGGTKPAGKLMELIHNLMNSIRGYGGGAVGHPTLKEFQKTIAPIKSAATRHKLPVPTFTPVGAKAAPSRRAQIMELAKRDPKLREGELELDEKTSVISEGDDNGAYVQTWMWVPFSGTPLDKDA